MPDDNHDLERYQNELSEATDDGDGCAEMWENLSDIRGDNSANRRSVLKGIGTIGISSLGLSGIASASERENLDQDTIEEILSSTEVSAILEELDNPEVKEDRIRNLDIKVEDQINADVPTIYIIPTEYGEISYTKTSNVGEDGIAVAHITGEDIPKKQYPEAPINGVLILRATGDSVFTTRTASRREQVLIEQETEYSFDGEGAKLFKIIDSNKYRAIFEDEEGGIPEIYELTVEMDNPGTIESIEIEPIDPFESDGVSVQDSCLNTCASCLGTVGGCLPCWAALPAVVTVAGAVIYLSCITLVCGIALPVFCGQCLACGT